LKEELVGQVYIAEFLEGYVKINRAVTGRLVLYVVLRVYICG
jgi:hypothetical protein